MTMTKEQQIKKYINMFTNASIMLRASKIAQKKGSQEIAKNLLYDFMRESKKAETYRRRYLKWAKT